MMKGPTPEVMHRLNHSRGGVLVAASVALLLVVAGCVNFRANYMAPRHGEIARDAAAHRLAVPYVMPPNAPSISQGYDPAPEDWDPGDAPKDHRGIDIVGKVGTPVLAAAPGTVVAAFFEPLFGHQVSIEHRTRLNGQPAKTNYWHLDRRMVSEGDVVAAGQQIGTLGASGVFAAFPHVHFEVGYREDGRWHTRNPHLFWLDGPGRITCFRERDEESVLLITYPVACLEHGEP